MNIFIKLFCPARRREHRNLQRHYAYVRSVVALVLDYYKEHGVPDAGIARVLEYLGRDHRFLPAFPYDFADGYLPGDVRVLRDPASGLFYVGDGGKKVFFYKGLSVGQIQTMCALLYAEQDPASPHRYLDADFDVQPGAVMLDVGAAEGNLSLTVADRASRIVLIEAMPEWREALEKTFEPWKEKTEIIGKYASDTDSEGTVTIDSVTAGLAPGTPVFLKLDVEGAEADVLRGAAQTLTSRGFDIRVAICTYHRQEDHEQLSALMRGMGYRVETVPGYMLMDMGGVKPPYLRHGLIRCFK